MIPRPITAHTTTNTSFALCCTSVALCSTYLLSTVPYNSIFFVVLRNRRMRILGECSCISHGASQANEQSFCYPLGDLCDLDTLARVICSPLATNIIMSRAGPVLHNHVKSKADCMIMLRGSYSLTALVLEASTTRTCPRLAIQATTF